MNSSQFSSEAVLELECYAFASLRQAMDLPPGTAREQELKNAARLRTQAIAARPDDQHRERMSWNGPVCIP